MAIGLNGRVMRLERALAPPGAHQCWAYGLRHVQPLTMDLARRLLGSVSIPATANLRRAAANPVPPLCLCDPCCGDPGVRALARPSHSTPSGSG